MYEYTVPDCSEYLSSRPMGHLTLGRDKSDRHCSAGYGMGYLTGNRLQLVLSDSMMIGIGWGGSFYYVIGDGRCGVLRGFGGVGGD